MGTPRGSQGAPGKASLAAGFLIWQGQAGLPKNTNIPIFLFGRFNE